MDCRAAHPLRSKLRSAKDGAPKIELDDGEGWATRLAGVAKAALDSGAYSIVYAVLVGRVTWHRAFRSAKSRSRPASALTRFAFIRRSAWSSSRPAARADSGCSARVK